MNSDERKLLQPLRRDALANQRDTRVPMQPRQRGLNGSASTAALATAEKVASLRLVSSEDDYLVCRADTDTDDGARYYVAKPFEFRGADVSPAYAADDRIIAVLRPLGGTGVTRLDARNNPVAVEYLDLNVLGRVPQDAATSTETGTFTSATTGTQFTLRSAPAGTSIWQVFIYNQASAIAESHILHINDRDAAQWLNYETGKSNPSAAFSMLLASNEVRVGQQSGVSSGLTVRWTLKRIY